ncbi:MAG: hypothetical protein AB1571_03195 [Nanoarchaeota archaeon]
MTDLAAILSTGKGTWGHVNRVMMDERWDNIFLITNEFGRENFSSEKKAVFIVVDSKRGLIELRDEIYNNLNGKLGSEVAVNLASGTGKEHTALIAALLKLGVGIRLVAATKEGIVEV